ncbi:hypothetical protein V1260_04185 [Brachybacterium sp. J144]|uniref:hypothetical protein n=1 Tax=Brachybacterium sp. J144 TaxID=3116487 RepID=UPI002E7AA379|nr:hypothetical protein [Brachybacterium sp. J144]MEE1649981.1 hypothetical protein [Brachybacterium sp. J144]
MSGPAHRAPRRSGAARVIIPLVVVAALVLTGAGVGAAWWATDGFRTNPVVALRGGEAPREEQAPRRQDAAPSTDGEESAAGDATADGEAPADEAPSADAAAVSEVPGTAAPAETADAADPAHDAEVGASPAGPEQVLPAPTSGDGPAALFDATIYRTLADDDDYVLVSSPSKNISCQLGGSSWGCSIKERNWGSDPCPGSTHASFLVYDGTFPQPNCGAAYLGRTGDEVLVLEYGEILDVDGSVQCSSAPDGLSCWSTWEGTGIKLSREELRLF